VKEDDYRMHPLATNGNSAQDLQKQQFEGIPADSFQESQKKMKMKINLNIPSTI